ncbi:MAG: hypothetical protein CMM05_01110 [Rhodopirellula sp.]|nr:hypothetical protein [Rhodopirellula sp.]
MRMTEPRPSHDRHGTTLRKNATNHGRHAPRTLGHLVGNGDKSLANLRLFCPLEQGKKVAARILRQRPAGYHGPPRIPSKTQPNQTATQSPIRRRQPPTTASTAASQRDRLDGHALSRGT